MTNRYYLPFKSAREYIDRGMEKWMGFFISEHTSALVKDGHEINISNAMTTEEKLILLGQVYVNDIRVNMYTNHREKAFVGSIYEISDDSIYFRSENKMINLKLKNIMSLSLAG